MDQRTDSLDQDIKDILHTRTAISEKLDLLERRITHTAQGATMKLSRAIDDTTEQVTHLVDSAHAALRPLRKSSQYPWILLGGAVSVGYAVGSLTGRARRGVYAYAPPAAKAARVMPNQRRARTPRAGLPEGVYPYFPTGEPAVRPAARSETSSIWSVLSKEFSQETDQAKAVLMEAGRSLVFELSKAIVPQIARAIGFTIPQAPSSARRPRPQPHRAAASFDEREQAGVDRSTARESEAPLVR